MLKGATKATHQRFIIVFRTARIFVCFAIGETASSFPLPVGVSVGSRCIDVHIFHRTHTDGDTRLDVAVGRILLIHGSIDAFRDAILRLYCKMRVISHDGPTMSAKGM